MPRPVRLAGHPHVCATALAAAALLAIPVPRVHAQAAGQGIAAAQSDEVPCTAMRSALHGVVLLGARSLAAGGPTCDLMQKYRRWLEQSDDLLGRPRSGEQRFSGREWDFAAGALRLGAPTWFVLIRGDSITDAPPERPRRLHLTAFAAHPDEAPTRLGSWYVLVDQDSIASRVFRSPVTDRRLHQVAERRGSVVYAVGGVAMNTAKVRAQLDEAQALRTALGFSDPLPHARYIVGPARDTTLATLGVMQMDRPLFAMTVYPPLAVFAPVTAEGALDRHELVHVATFGRRDVIPPSVGEAFAMHHGGAHGRSFGAAFCANRTVRTLDTLTVAGLDSALAGHWWNDPRADVTGFALGHAMGWFFGQRSDSSWIFADGEPARDADAIGFLATRAGVARGAAMEAIVEGFLKRRAGCPSLPATATIAVSPPSAAAGARRRASP